MWASPRAPPLERTKPMRGTSVSRLPSAGGAGAILPQPSLGGSFGFMTSAWVHWY